LLKVTPLAKWKTAVQMVAISMLFGWGLFDHYFIMQTLGMSPDIVAGILSGEIADSVGLWWKYQGLIAVSYGGLDPAVGGGGAYADHRVGLFSQGDAIPQGNAMKLDVHYFAWLRERLGTGRETVETEADTVADLIEELRARDEGYAHAFSDTGAIRAAVDQELVEFDAKLDGAREVAFFPPMTGG
jgi:molybdopterin synthase sulfur carrier subunit